MDYVSARHFSVGRKLRSFTCANWRVLIITSCCLSAGVSVFAQSRGAELASTTADRVQAAEWWPTKGAAAIEAYTGSKACSGCHFKEAASQAKTPMAQASSRPGENPENSQLPSANVHLGSYLYRVLVDTGSLTLVVNSANQSRSANIIWTFGAGVEGQTYILESKSALYESQVSSFTALHNLDLTPGHSQVEEGDIQNALGERLSTPNAAKCFGCHTTASSTKNQFDPKGAIPGVTCEACHGPGLRHTKLIEKGQIDEAEAAVLNPRSLSPVDSVDFCGACHRTSMDVVKARTYGPLNVRFQPYRLEKSRCWGTQGDTRLICIACHNPHEPLVRVTGFYDRRCLACHGSKKEESGGSPSSSVPVCPKATANCTNCHMPKYDVPETHAKFTDHFIRIVRDGEQYPN